MLGRLKLSGVVVGIILKTVCVVHRVKDLSHGIKILIWGSDAFWTVNDKYEYILLKLQEINLKKTRFYVIPKMVYHLLIFNF